MVDSLEPVGWDAVLASVDDYRQGNQPDYYSEGEEYPTNLALDAVERLRAQCQELYNPVVWGSTEDGGFYVEQHTEKEGETTVLLRINERSGARLSTFVGKDLEGPAKILEAGS